MPRDFPPVAQMDEVLRLVRASASVLALLGAAAPSPRLLAGSMSDQEIEILMQPWRGLPIFLQIES